MRLRRAKKKKKTTNRSNSLEHVFPDYPHQHNNYVTRCNQREWEASRHDSCRSALREATWNWMERSSEILRGDSIKVTEPSHPVFDFCGQVLDYNAGTCEVKVRLSEEVEGRRVGAIHRSMVTKIHGTRNNTVARSTIATQNHIYLED